MEPSELSNPLPATLFPAGYTSDGFLVASTFSLIWQPGASIFLRGPLGKGFKLPTSARRIALVAIGPCAGRLLPLIHPAISQGAAVLLLCDHVIDSIPPEVELLIFDDLDRRSMVLAEAEAWADYLALDLPASSHPYEFHLKVSGQLLVGHHFPCGGLGECGACSISGNWKRQDPHSTGFQYTCKDGPVFELSQLH